VEFFSFMMNKKNKKWFFSSLIIFIIIIAILLIIFIPKCQQKLTNEEILNIVQPEIDNYCSLLNSQVILSSCPTCQISGGFEYIEEEEYLEKNLKYNVYTFNYEKGFYLISMSLKVIYGRNDRPGFTTAEFKLDKQGNLIESNIQEKDCA